MWENYDGSDPDVLNIKHKRKMILHLKIQNEPLLQVQAGGFACGLHSGPT